MASFRKREDNTWEYRIRYKDIYTGKYKEKSKRGFKRKADAQEAANNVYLSLSDGYIGDNNLVSFEGYSKSWLDSMKTTVRFNTYDSRRQSLNRINKEIGTIYISKINYRIVQRYLNKMVEKEYGSSTIRQDFSTIKIVLLQAYREHLVHKDTLAGVKIPKGKQKKKVKWWTLDQLDKFLAGSNARLERLRKSRQTKNDYYEIITIRDRAIVMIMAGCGLREGELCGLLLSSYDSQNHLLNIHHNVVKKSLDTSIYGYELQNVLKTDNSFRTVPIPSSTWNAIDEWLEYRKILNIDDIPNGDGMMFTSPSDTKHPMVPTYVNSRITCVYTRYGLPKISPQSLRHTYASFLLQSGVPAKQAQMLLGHKDITTTLNIYTHVSETDKRKAVNLLDTFLTKKSTQPNE